MKLTPGWCVAGGAVLVVTTLNPALGIGLGLVAVLVALAANGTPQAGGTGSPDPRSAAWRAAEGWHLAWIVQELSGLRAQGMLGEEGHRLLGWFHWRMSSIAGAARPAVAWTPPASAASAPLPHGTSAGSPPQPPPPPARPQRVFEMREFLTDHAILLLSYAGAALLVTSTLLFILFGPDSMGGGWRASAVGGLNAALAAIAVGSRRREVTRVVSGPYTAMAAASLPLTLTAIYTYVLAGPTGMSVATALAIGGAVCAAVYTPLTLALRSPAYAATSLGTAVVGLCAAAVATDLGFVWLPGAAAVAAGGWWLAGRPPASRLAPFATPGHILAVIATLDAPLAGVLAAVGRATPDWLAGGHAVYLPATLALVGASTFVSRLAPRAGRGWMWLGMALTSLVPWTAAASLGGDATAQAFALMASGAVLGIAAALVAPRTTRSGTAPQLVDGLVAAAAAHLVAAASLAPSFAAAIVAVAVATAVGTAVALRGPRSLDGAFSFLGVLTALAATLAAVAAGPGDSASPPESWPVLAPIGLAVGLLGVLVAGGMRRSEPLIATLGLGITAVSLTAVSAWHGGHAGYPIALIAQSAAQAVLAAFLSGRLRTLTVAGSVLRLGVAAAVVVSPREIQVGLGASIAAVAVGLGLVAVRRPGPAWAVAGFASAAVGYAWYWATAAAVGSGVVPAEAFAVSTGVLGAVLAGGAAALRLAPWLSAREAAAGVAGVAASAFATGIAVALSDGDWTVATLLLGTVAIAAWIAGALPGEISALETAAAAVLATGAALAATTAAGIDTPQRVVCLSGVAVLVRGAVELERRARGDRRAAARRSAIGVALFGAGVAISSIGTVAPFLATGADPVPLAAAGALASIVAITLLAIDGGLLERCAGLAGAGLALDWLSLGLRETDVQAYAVAPSLAAIAVGLILRSASGRGNIASAALAAGLGVLLGSSGLQALADGGWYTPWLLAESIAVLLLAVWVQSRMCAAAAGTAVAAVCLRAVTDASTTVPLYALLGAGAGLLLGVALVLALARRQVEQARLTAAAGWARWGI